jgi:uncharacterized membrane protein YidH (DUF202 family)
MKVAAEVVLLILVGGSLVMFDALQVQRVKRIARRRRKRD